LTNVFVRAKKWKWSDLALAVAPVGFLALFFFYPLVVVLTASLGTDSAPITSTGWSRIAATTGFTFWQASLSTLLTFAVGLPGAYVLARTEFPGRRLLSGLTSLPFILPTVVVAAGFNALIGPRGWLNLAAMSLFGLSEPPIRLLGTLGAILLAHVFYNTTIVLRLVSGAWAGLNPRPGLAARTLGATPWQEFTRVTLPMLAPAIASAGLLVFLFDFTSFGVVMLMGGAGQATLEVEIYTQAIHLFNLRTAAVLTLIQFGCTLLISLGYKRVSASAQAGAPADEQRARQHPRRPGQILLTAVVCLVLVVLVVSPLAALVSRSFTRLEADRGQRGEVQTGLTLAYYQALFENPRQSIFYVPPIEAVRNSFTYGACTALLATLIGLPAAYSLRRRRMGRWLDVLWMLPLGASAVTMGLGMLLAFTRPATNWAGAVWMIPTAHTLVALPFVIRTLGPALQAIPENIRNAAGTLGASPLQVFGLVDLPLLRRPIISSLIFSFTISLGEFGATTFLARPDNPTIPVAIYRYLSQPGGLNYGQAMAMASILLAVFCVGLVIIEKLRLPGME
jgi:thiamine transport system permease protein